MKKNQKHLYEAVTEFLTSVREQRTAGFEISTHRTVDKGHGRIETREYWHTVAPDFLPDKKDWRALQSVGAVKATREIKAETTIEWRYYLSSLPVDAACFAHAVRTHWGIENACH